MNLNPRRLLKHWRSWRAQSAPAQSDTYSTELLAIISQAQSAYIDTQNQRQTFEVLLQRILEFTESAYGFIGEIREDENGQPYLKTIAISNIAWDDASRRFYAEYAPQGMEFRNLNSLFGRVIASGEALFSNDPTQDPRGTGMPHGHPALTSFMGLPFHAHGQLVGMLGVANRPAGYDSAWHLRLHPLLNTLGQLIDALRRDAVREQMQHSTQRQQQALRVLNEITALPTHNLGNLLRQALQRAADFYQMPNALISRILLDDVEVLYQVESGAGLNEGQHLALASTYCHLTLQSKDVLCIAHMSQSEYANHECYRLYGFESYISAVITVANRRFGTVSLSNSAVRSHGFDEADREFLRLFARWIGNLLERQQQEQERSTLLYRLQQITSQIPGMVFQYRQDKDGRRSFPYVSEGIQDIYGFSPEQVQHNSSIQQRIHPDDVAGMNQSIDRSAAKLSLWQEEYRVLHPQQGMIWVEGK